MNEGFAGLPYSEQPFAGSLTATERRWLKQEVSRRARRRAIRRSQRERWLKYVVLER